MPSRVTLTAALAACLVIVGGLIVLLRGSDQVDAAPAGIALAPPASDREAARTRAGPASAPAAERLEARRFGANPPPGAHPVVRVRRGAEVPIHTEPGGGSVVEVARRRTVFGSPTVFGVVRQTGGWAGVTTPNLPNGRLGWIRLDSDRLRSGWTRSSIVIDLSERRAEFRKGGEVKRSFAVTIGAPGIETPTGRFAVTDTFRGGLNPAYGCCALALSANQPRLPSGWLGGSRIAIHGTSGPLGVAASHGCVRAANSDASELVDRADLGSPVFIRA